MAEQKFDPKLKQAKEEIQAIMDKYDCGGAVSLTSKSHGEFFYHFPKWSTIYPEGRGFRVKLSSKEGRREEGDLSTHFVFSTRDATGMLFKNFFDLADMVQKTLEARGSGVDHTPLKDFTPSTDGMN